MRRTIVGALCLLAGLAAGFSGAAGVRSGSFTVNICLTSGGDCAGQSPAVVANLSGICTSDSLSERTGALVRVVCETGQFVSIAPRPDAKFVGTHGGAYTYSFRPAFDAMQRARDGQFATASGTIASYRIYNVTEIEGPLEMLVSF